MADELIDFISSKAFEDLKKLNIELSGMVKNVKTIKQDFANIKLPSGGTKLQGNIESQLLKQENAIKRVQIQSKKLADQELALIKKRELALERQSNKELSVRKSLQRQKEQSIKATQKEANELAKLDNVYNRIQNKINATIPVYNNLQAKQSLGLKLSAREEAQLITITNRLNRYQKVLKDVDIKVGNHRREVGNYAKANSNLSNSLGQISRELPNFGQSFSIGVLSLTNNIGALQDAIKQVKNQNIALKKEGKATKSLFSQIGSSLLSFNTLLFVGIGVFSAYSKQIGEWVTSLFKGSKALRELKESQKEFLNLQLTGRKNAQQELLELKKNLAVINDTSLSLDKRNIALKNIRSAYPFYFKDLTDEAILTGKTKTAINELTEALEKRKQIDKASELNVRNRINLLDLEKKAKDEVDKSFQKKFYTDEQKREIKKLGIDLKELTKQAKETAVRQSIDRNKDVNKIRQEIAQNEELIIRLKKETIALEYKEVAATKDNLLNRLKLADVKASEFALNQKILNDEKDKQGKTADDETKSFSDRRESRERFYIISLSLAEAQKNEELRLLKESNANAVNEVNAKYKKQEITEKEKNKLINAIIKKAYFDRLLILQNYNNETRIINEEIAQNIDETISKIADKKDELSLIDKKELEGLKLYSEALKELSKNAGLSDLSQDENGLNKFENFQKAKKDILDEAAKQRIELNLKEVQSEIKKQSEISKNSEEYQDLLKKEIDLKKSLANINVKLAETETKETQRKLQNMKSYLDGFASDLADSSGFGSIFDILNNEIEGFGENFAVTFNGLLEAGSEVYNKLSENSQIYFDEENARLEKNKELAIRFAGDSKEAQERIEDQHQEKKKALRLKEAQAEKQLAIFNVLIKTSQAVVGALAQLPSPSAIPLSIAVGIMGAAQAVAIGSRKIPKYKDGTDNHTGGLMIINDGLGSDYAEVVQEPNKAPEVYEGRNVMLNKPKGTKVFTQDQWNDELNSILLSNNISQNQPISVNNGISKDEYFKGVETITKTINNKKSFQMIYDENGFKKYNIQNGKREELINNHINTKISDV